MTHGWWAICYSFWSYSHSYVWSWSVWGHYKLAEERKMFCIVDGDFLLMAIMIAWGTLLILDTTPRITEECQYTLLSLSARGMRNNGSFKRHNPNAVITMQGIEHPPEFTRRFSVCLWCIWLTATNEGSIRFHRKSHFFRNSVRKMIKVTHSVLSMMSHNS